MKTRIYLPLSLLVTPLALLAQAALDIPPAIGTNINLRSRDYAQTRSFGPKDSIVGTYYFYWYDARTKEHIIDGDGTDALTDHPADMEDFSYTSVSWHRRELSDMIAAGIDVVLPVFWGAPSERDPDARLHWSYAGLPPLVQAREELVRQGKRPPYIGLFYDTSTLQYNQWREHVDLTTERGRQWFYATIRDFFSMIPPQHWAMLQGKPMVLLYSAGFARNHDQKCIDYAKEQFAAEFGGRTPWIAAEVSWRVQADSKVAWGGALGLKNPGVASLGPGYDHSAVPGREPLIVKRENGKFYEENWLNFLRRPSQLVMVETWNEFHEGTEVAESREYGRQYIDLTRKYAGLFKRGWQPPWPKGAYSRAKSVTITLAQENSEQGLKLVENEDGLTTPTTVGDREGRAMKRNVHGGHYVYFAVDDSFKWANRMDTVLEVEYFDAAPGRFGVEYDGSDRSAAQGGAYTRSRQNVTLTGSKTWKTAEFLLDGAHFLNSQNRGADFRLVLETPEFIVGKVTLFRE